MDLKGTWTETETLAQGLSAWPTQFEGQVQCCKEGEKEGELLSNWRIHPGKVVFAPMLLLGRVFQKETMAWEEAQVCRKSEKEPPLGPQRARSGISAKNSTHSQGRLPDPAGCHCSPSAGVLALGLVPAPTPAPLASVL